MQTSSMLTLRRFVWYLVGAAGVRPFFAYLDEQGTMLVWADDDWSGNAMTCRATSAGAVQLESHEIEAWCMIQQMVSFSSAESEFYAIEAPNEDRRSPEARSQDWREAVEEVPDTIDSLNKEAKCTKPVFANRGREAESLPTRYHGNWPRLRMRRRAQAILTQGSWKRRRC